MRHETDLLAHEPTGSDTDTAILRGVEALGHPVGRESFALRNDDPIVQWQAVRAGWASAFAPNMARNEPDVLPVLRGLLKMPPMPMWLAAHREIGTSQRIRAVFDYLAQNLPQVL